MLTIDKKFQLSDEDQFIKELSIYLEYPLSEYGKNRVKQMLLAYKMKNPMLKVVSKSESTNIIKEINSTNVAKNMTFSEIANIVGEYVNIPPSEYIVKKRKREYVYARYFCMFFCKQYTSMSLKNIGIEILGRDHTTVMAGIQKLKDLIDSNENIREDVQNINNNILKLKISKTEEFMNNDTHTDS